MKVLGEGSALLGGSPTRLLRLAPAAQTMLSGGRLEVHDAQSAQLARTLLDATVAHPRPASGPSHRDVTVVIPVRDNAIGLNRLVRSLRGMRVVVVDDGSTVAGPGSATSTVCTATSGCFGTPRSKGPSAARNTGLAACETDFVAFLDSDVVPRRGWLEALLGHFCDPAVALVAPRIVGLREPENLVARYEAVRSSLDLGQREAPVVPYGTVSYVPSAAIICRRGVAQGRRRVRRDVDRGRGRRPVLAVHRSRRAAALRAHRAGRPRSSDSTARVVRAQGILRFVGGPAVGSTSGQDRAVGDLRVDAAGVGAAGDGLRLRVLRVHGRGRRSPAAGSPTR